MSNADIFLDKYKKLEQKIKAKYNLEDYQSAFYELSRLKEFYYYKEDIKYIREVRNLLSHKPKINNSYPVEPSKSLLDILDKIDRLVTNPPIASNILTPIDKITYGSINDNIINLLKIMNEKGYSHIPILKDKKVLGVFSQSSLFYALLNGTHIDNDSIFTKELISSLCQNNESSSEKYLFINKDMPLQEIQNLFNYNYKKNNRIVMCFVSENGKENEKILGIITPYDAMDKDNI